MDRDFLSKTGLLALLFSALGVAIYFSRPLTPSGKTVVRYLTYETGPEQMALSNEIKRRFEAANPDVEVQIEFNNSARDKIYVELASGTAPDTFYEVTDDIPRLAYKNAIEPLNEWAAKDPTAHLDQYFSKVLNALRYAPPGQAPKVGPKELYAYPVNWSTDVLFYNEAAFRKAGVAFPNERWTWNDMIAAARKLTIRDASGRVTQFGIFLPDPTTTIESNRAPIFNADYTRCAIDNPSALEAMTTLRDLRFKENVAPSPAQLQESSNVQMFELGEVAMLPGRTYMAVDFNKIKEFTYDTSMLPGMKDNVVRLAVGGMCMSRASKVKDAAYRWMKFFTSESGGMQVLAKMKNAVTPVKRLALSPDYFMKPPPQHMRIFVTSLKDAVITVPPIVGASEYLNRIRNPMFDDMERDPNGNIAAMLKNYQDETNKLLEDEPKG